MNVLISTAIISLLLIIIPIVVLNITIDILAKPPKKATIKQTDIEIIEKKQTNKIDELINTLSYIERKQLLYIHENDQLQNILMAINKKQSKKHIWQFDYHVETTTKLLNTLIELCNIDEKVISENAKANRQEIITAIPDILIYFENVLNDLDQAQYIDSTSDIDVMKKLTPQISIENDTIKKFEKQSNFFEKRNNC